MGAVCKPSVVDDNDLTTTEKQQQEPADVADLRFNPTLGELSSVGELPSADEQTPKSARFSFRVQFWQNVLPRKSLLKTDRDTPSNSKGKPGTKAGPDAASEEEDWEAQARRESFRKMMAWARVAEGEKENQGASGASSKAGVSHVGISSDDSYSKPYGSAPRSYEVIDGIGAAGKRGVNLLAILENRERLSKPSSYRPSHASSADFSYEDPSFVEVSDDEETDSCFEAESTTSASGFFTSGVVPKISPGEAESTPIAAC